MSRSVLLFFVCLSSFSPLLAQPTHPIRFGLKVGYNWAKFQQAPTPIIDHFLGGYSVGLTAQRPLSTAIGLALVTDLLYSQQGSVEPIIQGVTDFDKIRYRYTYLTLPLRLIYKPKAFPFQVGAGLQGGYLLQASRTLHVLSGYPTPNTAPYDNSYLKKIDLGWQVSLSYPVSHHWQVEVNYYRSLSTLTKSVAGYDPLTGQYFRVEQVYNQLISSSLSYYLK